MHLCGLDIHASEEGKDDGRDGMVFPYSATCDLYLLVMIDYSYEYFLLHCISTCI